MPFRKKEGLLQFHSRLIFFFFFNYEIPSTLIKRKGLRRRLFEWYPAEV